jgi:MinD superfamily P-loop ATPase
MNFRYLKDVVTLKLDEEKCIGCGMCTQVCVHAVFTMNGRTAHISDRDACMECSACAMNCPVEAVSVRSGVGCAYAVFTGWFRRNRERGEARPRCC